MLFAKSLVRLLIAVALLFPTIGSQMASAQSTYDLEPPMQVESNTAAVLMSADPSALPTFVFAVASIEKDGKIKIARSVPVQEALPVAARRAPPGFESYTENVTQNYTVMVPVTEKVDGKMVTKMRPEVRSRTVPVVRMRKKKTPDGEEPDEKDKEEGEKKEEANETRVEMVKIPSTTNVTFTEVVDGEPVTKMRKVTRTRTVQVTRGKVKTTASVTSEIYDVGKLKCFDSSGKSLSQKQIETRLMEKAAVILINDRKSIQPFFKHLIKPGCFFVICPNK